MSPDSCLQSSGESWIIQSESIQIYLISNSRAMEMASWKVRGRASKGMPFLKADTLDDVVLMNCSTPQQCESVAYRGMPAEMSICFISTRMMDESGRGYISRSRVGITLWGLLPHEEWVRRQLVIQERISGKCDLGETRGAISLAQPNTSHFGSHDISPTLLE